MEKFKKMTWVICMCSFFAFISLLSGVCFGSAKISISKVAMVFLNWDKDVLVRSIIFNIRVPRVILAFSVGGSLSLCGIILQGILRNPLVEPYTLGVSGASALVVVICIASGVFNILGAMFLPVAGFIGAMFVTFLLYVLSSKDGKFSSYQLLLLGVMVSFICSSFVMLIMALVRVESLQSFLFWLVGSLDETNISMIKILFLTSITGLIISYFFCVDLNALVLGECEAINLGINVHRSKKILFIITSVLTGFCVSVVGMIGFVGLLIPHFVRMLVGHDYRISLVVSYILGGAFLVICDILSRVVSGYIQIPVGVVTGILGGVLFIFMVISKRVRGVSL